jgi:HEAT repeat protein
VIKYFTAILLFISLSSKTYPHETKNQILYLMQKNKYKKAISFYQQLYEKTKEQDFEIIEEMALILLKKGARSKKKEKKQLTMFAAGLAASTKSVDILEKGLFSEEMPIQLTALHFISALQDNKSNSLLIKAMSSNFLETRFEAAYQMALKKHPHALGCTTALMNHLPPFFKPFFPQFFGIIGTSEAISMLKNFLYDANPNVRLQAILSILQNKRDDLLNDLKKKLNHSSSAEKEAILYSLGNFSDSSSIEKIKKYANSNIENIKLAALLALNDLGDKALNEEIFKLSKSGNLFAISSLAKIEKSTPLLLTLLQKGDLQIKINAALALLRKKDSRSLKFLKKFFFEDFLVLPKYSLGKVLTCFELIKANKNTKNFNSLFAYKMNILREILELEENDFLFLAKEIFDLNKNELIPTICNLLLNLRSEKAIELLKIQTQKIGAPFIRDYTNLTLYKITGDDSYMEYLKNWLKKNNTQKAVNLKEFEKDKIRFEKTQFELSPFETSHLMIEIFSAFAEKHSIEGVMLLLDAMKKTHPLNKYPLAGLLLKAIE